MTPRQRAQALARLRDLAAIKRDQELARLATVAQSRQRLQNSLQSVRDNGVALVADQTDPAALRATLAHARWADQQAKRLNQQLALVTADYLRLRPQVARAFGRAQVLDDMTRAQTAQARAKEKPGA